MEPVPSTVLKVYPPRGPLQQYRFKESTTFRCFRCGDIKKSRLIVVYGQNWSRKLCNGCYGRLLSLYEVKTGSMPDDERVEYLTNALFSLVSVDEVRQFESLFRVSESRALHLSSEALRFIATAEHVAGQLEPFSQLEWSPAIIGLCKAVEVEVVSQILKPLAVLVDNEDLSNDKKDKDIGRVAIWCAEPQRKPPELGTFSHFLQTVIYSEQRRRTSKLISCFLRLVSEWTDSVWLLEPDGLYRSLTLITTRTYFKNTKQTKMEA